MRGGAALGVALLLVAAGGAAWWLARDEAGDLAAQDGSAGETRAVIQLLEQPADGGAARPFDAAGLPVPLPPARDAPARPPAEAPPKDEPSADTVAGMVRRLAASVPLRDARVELLGAPGADGKAPVLASLVTQDDGLFRLQAGGARPAALVVTWQAMREVLDEGSSWDARISRDPVVQRVELPAGKPLPHELTLTLDTGWRLAGKVVDGSGAGLEGAFVLAGKDGPEARTKLDGSYILWDVERKPVPVTITAWAPFRERQIVAVPVPDRSLAGASQDFALPRAGSVSGFVIDSDGRSLPGARVHARVCGATDGSTAPAFASALVEPSGRYTLGDLPDGAFDLLCTWQWHEPGTSADADVRRTGRVCDVAVRSDIPAVADIRLARSVTLSGRALDRGATARALGSTAEYWTLSGRGATARATLVQARAGIHADGTFTLSGLEPGPGELRLLEHEWRSHHAEPTEDPWTRELGGGQDWLLKYDMLVVHAVRLDLPAEGLAGLEVRRLDDCVVQGSVVDAAGKPLALARVDQVPLRESAPGSTVDAGGRFAAAFDRWWHGPVRLRVSEEEHVPAFIDLPTCSGFDELGPVTLALAPAIKLLVVDADSGDVLPQASVLWHLYGDARREALVSVPRIGDAPAVLRADRTTGNWVLLVEAPGHRPWRKSSVLEEAGRDPAELVARLVKR